MEKQIKEIAEILASDCEDSKDCSICIYNNDIEKCCYKNAERIYKQDYRKVIMCKDCKISNFGYFEKEIGKEAVEGYYCRKYREMKLPNDFCSDGVKKGE